MKSYLGFFFIFAAAFCWALIGPVARFSLGSSLDAMELAFWRAAVGGGMFLVHTAIVKELAIRSKKDLAVFALFGACSLGGFFAVNQYSIETGGAALAAVLLYTAPAWVAVFSRLIFKERFTLIKAVAITLSLVGVACISLSSPTPEMAEGALPPQTAEASAFSFGSLNAAGIIFGLISGFLYSTHYVFSKKYLPVYSTHTLYGYCMLFGGLVLFPAVEFASKSLTDWAVILCIGGISTYGAYSFYCAGIKLLDPTKAAVLATLEPVIATALAWWLWGEVFSLPGWIGAALVIGAVLVMILEPQKAVSDEPAPYADLTQKTSKPPAENS